MFSKNVLKKMADAINVDMIRYDVRPNQSKFKG